MSEAIAISVQHIGKTYRIWGSPVSRLLSPFWETLAGLLPEKLALSAWLKKNSAGHYRDFSALKDLSFEIRKGESMGIIGRNGSGKSTLLQIIAGTLQPSTGSVKVNGRIAALLELGSGFNPEFTGRENVHLNATVLGLSRREIEARFDGIAEFADIGDFIDQPVKTYSSGMQLRLAFAVQTAVDPDILIVDEALSVGDAPFQSKCFARLRTLQSRGCSILFVSHDIGTVRTFCQHAIWLKEGSPQIQGAVAEVCDAYARECARATGMDFEESSSTSVRSDTGAPSRSKWLTQDRSEFAKLAAIDRHGGGPVRLRNFFLLNEKGLPSATLRWDEPVTAVFVVGTTTEYEGLFQVGLVCKTLQSQELMSCSDRMHDLRLRLAAGEEIVITLQVRLPLRSGKYLVTAGLYLFPDDARFPTGTFDFTRATAADYVTHCAVFEIAPQFNLGIYGPVHQEAQLAILPPREARTKIFARQVIDADATIGDR